MGPDQREAERDRFEVLCVSLLAFAFRLTFPAVLWAFASRLGEAASLLSFLVDPSLCHFILNLSILCLRTGCLGTRS